MFELVLFVVATFINDERFGRSDLRSSLNYVNCTSSMTSLSQCNFVRKISGGCKIGVSKCSKEFGLRCHSELDQVQAIIIIVLGNVAACTDGQTRLVDGVIEQEGRIEVCYNGIWGGVCSNNFDQADAFVACKAVGYPGKSNNNFCVLVSRLVVGPSVKYNAYYGESSGPLVYNNLQCYGWEDSLFECPKSVFPTFNCASQYAVGVICKDG